MNKIFSDIALSLIIILVGVEITVGLFYEFIPNQYETNYVSVMYDKYERLHEVESPKIVLVGDSNLAFGIDSGLLQELTGMPVVNMGLHGGLGNDIQSRLAMSNICEGDIYVLCYTDYSQTEDISQKDLTLLMLANHDELWDEMSVSQKLKLFPAIPNYIWSSLSYYFSGRGNERIPYECSDYSYAAFDVYGDNKVRIKNNYRHDLNQSESRVGTISKQMIEMIHSMNSICEECGATVVIAGYPIIMSSYMDSADAFCEYGQRIEECTGVENISDFSDYIMPSELFYDSILHLSLEGAEYRTRILAKDISEYKGDIE